MIFRSIVAGFAILAMAPALAQHAEDSSARGAAENSATHAAAEIPDPVVSVTRHRGTFGGQSVNYTATAGETYLTDDDGNPNARIFSIAYIRDGGDASRPITFLFNGGPGSGSLWLHMGAFGPRRVAIPSNGTDDGAPPYRVIDNPDSLLDVTDIVFIDPVGTGFSTALGGTEPTEFWGVDADARSIGTFIRRWLSENNRWNSPKYLGGESYGTTRTAAVVNELEGSFNDVAFNGLLLISTILDFGAQAEVPGNEMPYVLHLPTMAATAFYHNRAPAEVTNLESHVAAAREFARGDYLTALIRGSDLQADARADIRRRLAYFTGLSETYLDQADLRVSPRRYYKELLRDQGLTVGRLDSRYTGRDYDSAGETPDNDPSFYGIDASYTAALNTHVRETLGFNPDRQYVTIGGVSEWDWDLSRGGRDSTYYRSVAPYIGRAMRENSGLQVFVAQGYYDFATPFFGAEYALSRTGMPTERIHYHYYGAGHMMYVNEPELTQLTQDIRAFIRGR